MRVGVFTALLGQMPLDQVLAKAPAVHLLLALEAVERPDVDDTAFDELAPDILHDDLRRDAPGVRF